MGVADASKDGGVAADDDEGRPQVAGYVDEVVGVERLLEGIQEGHGVDARNDDQRAAGEVLADDDAEINDLFARCKGLLWTGSLSFGMRCSL